jgi:hypothetical protein
MSVYLDGTGDYLGIGDDAALNLPTESWEGWSLAAWVKIPDLTGSVLRSAMTWGEYYATPSVLWGWCPASHPSYPSRWYMLLRDGDGTTCGFVSDDAASGKITDTNWHHIAWTCDGTTHRMYLDGVVQTATPSNADVATLDAAADWKLGSGVSNNWNGYLADAARWNDALSDAQVAGLAGGKTALWYPTNLVWYCPLKSDLAEKRVPLTVTAYGDAAIDAEHPAISDQGGMHHYIHKANALSGGMVGMGV